MVVWVGVGLCVLRVRVCVGCEGVCRSWGCVQVVRLCVRLCVQRVMLCLQHKRLFASCEAVCEAVCAAREAVCRL